MMEQKIPLLVVCGPTASGKTRLAADLAKRFGGEVVGADSMQIYKGMDIGTAKPTPDEMQNVPHHLIDFLKPGQSFSVADYVRLAKKTIAEIYGRGRLPVLAGGTGLYISSLIDNIDFEEIAADHALRGQLRAQAGQNGAQWLHDKLRAVDPALAEKLHPNNQGRIIRALEVYGKTGVPMSEVQRRSRETPSAYDVCMIGLGFRDRNALYRRIDSRVDAMLAGGLLEEAKRLMDAGLSVTAGQAIGYKELARYFAGDEPLEQAAERIRRETRRYAKRQLTWLRRDARIHWLYADEYESYHLLFEAAANIAAAGSGT